MRWSMDWSVDLSIGGRDGRLRVGFSRFTCYFFIITLREEEKYIMFIFASYCNGFVYPQGNLILRVLSYLSS